MTTRPDPDPVISAWLNDEAAERAPEHLLSATRTRIESTNQRRARWPAWRLQPMNNRSRLGGAVAAIAVIVVLGFVLIPRPTGIGGPTPTPSPTTLPSVSPTRVPTPAPTSTPSPPAVIPPGKLCSSTTCVTGTLEAGTYSIDAGAFAPGNLTFKVPAGWTTDQGFVRKNFDLNSPTPIEDSPNELVFSTWFLTNVFTDACHWKTTMVSAGTTVDQLTSLLLAQKGRVASAPTSTSIGGFAAKRIQLTVPTRIDLTTCDSGVLHAWPDPGGSDSGGLCCGAAGSTDAVDVINVAGQTFVVVARHAAGASPADLAELNALVASIKIAAPPPTPKPSGASPSP